MSGNLTFFCAYQQKLFYLNLILNLLYQVKRKAEEEKLAEVMAGKIKFFFVL